MIPYTLRQEVKSSDLGAILRIVQSSGYFSIEEEEMACELLSDRLNFGSQSSYNFLILEVDHSVAGYTCYGLIPATQGSFDLYWIAVTQSLRGHGLGKILLSHTEDLIRQSHGRIVYVETSSRTQYFSTQCFYQNAGYISEAFLNNFYAPGDSKIIYSKVLI